MSTIIITQDSTGQVLADGELGVEVIETEGNYYFSPEQVTLDEMGVKQNAYTCPVKKGNCDYLYLKDEKGKNALSEVAWVYRTVQNPAFKNLEGRIGFYPKSGRGVTMTVLE